LFVPLADYVAFANGLWLILRGEPGNGHITVCATYPPELAEVFGYRGQARFVAFSWTPAGDQVVFDDGRSCGTGQSWSFLTWRRHRSVSPLLAPFNLGYSDHDADHCLVIDRERNRASIAPLGEARAFLHAQHPPAPELTPEQAETVRRHIEEAIKRRWQEAASAEAMGQAIAEQRGRLGRMIAWLDMAPVPPQRREGHEGP
jgi:hypothetical protein